MSVFNGPSKFSLGSSTGFVMLLIIDINCSGVDYLSLDSFFHKVACVVLSLKTVLRKVGKTTTKCHHVHNIGGTDNCYGLNNCLDHSHLYLDNYHNYYYCNSLCRRCYIARGCLGIVPYNFFADPFPFLGNLCRVLYHGLVGPCRVCGLHSYLCGFHYNSSYLSLYNVPLLQRRGRWLRLLL